MPIEWPGYATILRCAYIGFASKEQHGRSHENTIYHEVWGLAFPLGRTRCGGRGDVG
ncbi:MAG: hypothetical protein ACI8V4_002670, partial [Ilumatobacter sp.]